MFYSIKHLYKQTLRALDGEIVIPTFSRSGDSGAAAGPRPAEKISSA